MSGPFVLYSLDAPPPEAFPTLRELAERVLEMLGPCDPWLGDARVVIADAVKERPEEHIGVFLRKAIPGAHGPAARGDMIGVALLPLDPALGSFGGRERLLTALRRAAWARQAKLEAV